MRREPRGLTARRLAEDLGVCRRTVARDLDLLRDDWHAPVVFDWRVRGFRLTDAGWVPSVRPEGEAQTAVAAGEGAVAAAEGASQAAGTRVPLAAGEAVALVLALQAFDAMRGGGFEAAFRSLLAKLPQLLPEWVSVDPGALARGVSFYFEPPRGDREEVAEALERLRTAVEARRVVRLAYYTASRDEETVRLVEPYHLRYYEGVWYLVGWCRWRGALRTFAVDRVRGCEVLAETFRHRHRSGFRRRRTLARRGGCSGGRSCGGWWCALRRSRRVTCGAGCGTRRRRPTRNPTGRWC